MVRFIRSVRGTIFLIALLALLLCSLIWVQLASQLNFDRNAAIASAIRRNDNLVVSLEQNAVHIIRNAESVLELVKMEYERDGERFDLRGLLGRGVIDTNYFHSVFLIASNGQIRVSSIPPIDINLSDRQHFRYHREGERGLFISEPVISRTIGRSVVVLSRRLQHRDGSFAGTVAVQIEPATFTRFYANARLNPDDIISLIAPNGVTYARRTGQKESYGENISASPLFRHLERTTIGNYQAPDALRGVPTYFSYRRLQPYPVIATVGISEKDVLADYYDRRQNYLAFGMVISLLVWIIAIAAASGISRRRKAVLLLEMSEKRYRSIYENSRDGLLIMHGDGFIEDMNGAAATMFRTVHTGSSLLNFRELYRDAQPEVRMPQPGVADPRWQEVVFGRHSGTSFVAEYCFMPFPDPDGEDRYLVLLRDISIRKEMEKRLIREQKRYQRKLTRQIIHAQERERESIGHELHDNVNQILTTVKLYLEMARENPGMRDELLPRSIGHIMDCINEIRQLSHQLSAPTLGTQSLVDSIKALVETVSGSSGLEIQFEHAGYRRSLAKEQKLAIFRILQEQLTNVIKHAGARNVKIELSQCELHTRLEVSDDGQGFDTARASSGIGLLNISSRAKVFGGSLSITSSPGAGTCLLVTMPTVPDEAADPSTTETIAGTTVG